MSTELTKIRGIGPKTAEKLISRGIHSVEDLVTAPAEEVASILGCSLAKAKSIINAAKEEALASVVEVWSGERMKEYLEKEVQRIPTGIDKLDALLGGGFRTDAVVGVSGSSATGKTELGMTLCVNCVKHLKRPFVWIETEPATFKIGRLMEIAKARGVDINLGEDVFVVPAKDITSPQRQMLAYERVDKWAWEKGVKPGLIVVDSFVAKIREYYSGRELLSARSKEIARHMGYLQMLSSKYNTCIYLTEQVYGVPDTATQLQVLARFGDVKKPYGGEFLLHAVSMHLTLVRTKGSEWMLVTDDVPGVPMTTIPFKITSRGVEGI